MCIIYIISISHSCRVAIFMLPDFILVPYSVVMFCKFLTLFIYKNMRYFLQLLPNWIYEDSKGPRKKLLSLPRHFHIAVEIIF